MENEKLGQWYSVHANCMSILCAFFKLFQKRGSNIYQINKNWKGKKIRKSKINCYDVISLILQFSLKFV